MPDPIQTPAGRRRRLRARIISLLNKAGFKEEYLLLILAVLIGGITGIGGYIFFHLIEYATEMAYGDDGSLYAGRWYMLVALPMAGALLTGLITHNFAPEAKGHGVPEVMDSIYRQGGVVRMRVAIAKSIASACTIGSGGSAGTEGPIVQIGAAFGSGFGQYLQVPRREMGVLLACGAAAGISAIFNAPIAGVLFALEIFLRDFSLRTFSPVVFASVISCSVMHALLGEGVGDVAIFQVHQNTQYVFNGMELPFYLVLGLLAAMAAVAFIRVLYATEDLTDKLRVPEYLKPVLGAACLGLLGAVFLVPVHSADETMPAFFGNGYRLIQLAIDSETVFRFGMGSLLALCAVKIIATSVTLGTGGSGGIFAPSLFMGATIGGAFGLLLHRIGWIDDGSVSAYALVGMAALIAATTHAPLTAIVILYEITREPKVILPVMFAAIIATWFAQRLSRDSIYTLKLRRRGVRVGTVADLTILKNITADQVRTVRAVQVHPEDPLQKLLDLAVESECGDFVVVDDKGEYIGLVVAQDIRTALLQPDAVPLLVVAELTREGIPTVKPNETLDVVLDVFAQNNVQSLPLVNGHDDAHVEALITRHALIARYQQELDRSSA